MSDERSFLHSPEFWDHCVDHYSANDGQGSLKQRDEIEYIQQLLQSGQPFSGDRYNEVTVSQPINEGSNSEESEEPLSFHESISSPEVKQAKSKTGSNKAFKHKCDTCSQVFDSKIALSIHTGRIHKHEGRDKNYQCTRCSKAFFNSSYLAQHMRIHTGQKPYACNECDKKFTQLSHLQQHKRTHSGEKPYRCQQPGCTKAFSQLSNLQSHTRSHLPDGNVHKCTSCYKCYFDEASLNAHLRTHMVNKRIRNYRCEECGKSYTQDTYLQNHINSKHGGELPIEPAVFTSRPLKQPTSIQAATSMICKVEDVASTSSCGMQRSTSTSQIPQSIHGKVLPPASLLTQPNYQHEEDFDVAGAIPQTFGTVGQERRCQYPDNNSAFKPVIHNSRSSYDRPSLPQGESTVPMVSPADAKTNADEDQSSDLYWRLRSTISAPGLSSYSSVPRDIQNYMASQSNYPYSAYLNAPFGGIHYDKSSMYSGDVTSDYLMGGGFRESYHYD